MLLRFSPLDIRAMPPKILRAGAQPQLSTQNPEAPPEEAHDKPTT